MNHYPSLVLKPGKEKSLERKHPWIFSGALQEEIKHTPQGSLVNIVDSKQQFLACGYVQHGSIAVRILSFEKREIDGAYWEERIGQSYRIRQSLGLESAENTCYRLMHGEGDGVPGLIIDIYGKTAVLQCHSSGLYQHVPTLTEALKKTMGSALEAVYNKSKEALHGAIPDAENSYVWGEAKPGPVLENGMHFEVNWEAGQKTGFFLDQRDNRQLLGHYAQGKTVLNTFSYTGGFSVYAAKHGASRVVSVDVSKHAIEALNKNMELNGIGEEVYESYAEDSFQFFKRDERVFDMVVLDPPAFAKNVGARHNALMGYKRLNSEGMKKVKPGGLLFTFSCSQVVDSETFNKTVYSAALETGRDIKILHRLSQGADHPVNIYHKEGEYLKGLVLWLG